MFSWMWCGGVYIGGARIREKEDFNGDWEVIECNEFAKTGPRTHLDIISDQEGVKRIELEL